MGWRWGDILFKITGKQLKLLSGPMDSYGQAVSGTARFCHNIPQSGDIWALETKERTIIYGQLDCGNIVKCFSFISVVQQLVNEKKTALEFAPL